MKKKFLSFMVMGLLFLGCQNASAILMTFEDLPLGHTYNIGDTFYSLGVELHVSEFTPTAGGGVTVDNLLMADASGQELQIQNANLEFMLNYSGCQGCAIALLFGQYGVSQVSLGINDTIVTKTSFLDFNHSNSFPGTDVFVRSNGALGSILVITGDIDKFTIGGLLGQVGASVNQVEQGVFIDDVVICQQIPEPATISLLAIGGLSLLARKRKRS
jgi:hypothetical protein